MVVAKRQERGKDHENRTKEVSRTRVRISGKTNSTPGWPNLHRAGSGGGEKKHKKRSLSSLHIFWVSMPSGCIFLYFLNKTEL